MVVKHVLYYEFDNFRLDLEKHQLLKDGEPVLLTHKAFQTLHILVQNNGQIVEKEDIYNSIWADSFVEEANLTQYIYLLRKTLDKNPAGSSYIQTVARRGYVFAANVQKVFAPETKIPPFQNSTLREVTSGPHLAIALKYRPEEKSLVDVAPLRLVTKDSGSVVIDEPDKPSTLASFPTKQRSARHFVLAVVLLFAITVAGVGVYLYFSPDRTVSSTSVGVSSVAVLPFRPIDQESNSSKLGFGMADAIITRLSNLKKVQVRPTSSVFRYIDAPPVSNAAAGADLGVDAILEGTVQRDGDRVRVSVQLYNVLEGKPTWAEKFDEKSTDVFSLQDSIAAKVVSALSLKLTPEQWKFLEYRPTESAEAAEAYELGVYFWNTRSRENLAKAEVHFLKAIELDPKFAKAHAMLADTYNMLGYYRFADRTEMTIKATVAAAKAIELDETVAEAHVAMAYIKMTPTGMDGAKRSLERAIELSPYNATARVRYGWMLMQLNQLDEAVAQMRYAREYDPLSPVSNGALCNMLTYRESFGEAIPYCRRSVELSPENGDTLLVLANVLFFSGNSEEAISLANKVWATGDRNFSALGSLGYFYAKLGRRVEAEKILPQLSAEATKEPFLLNDIVLIEYALGARDQAFEHFREAYKNRVVSGNGFRHDPVWKEIRSDVRFSKMMEE